MTQGFDLKKQHIWKKQQKKGAEKGQYWKQFDCLCAAAWLAAWSSLICLGSNCE